MSKPRVMTLGVGLILSGVAVGMGVRSFLVPRPEPYATYTWTSDLSLEENEALSFFTDLSNRQFHWSADDWARVEEYAADPTRPIGIRTGAIFHVGEQAGCDKCMDSKRAGHWTVILIPLLTHENEYMRQAACHVLYQIGGYLPEGFTLANDPSEVVRYTWKMTFGRHLPERHGARPDTSGWYPWDPRWREYLAEYGYSWHRAEDVGVRDCMGHFYTAEEWEEVHAIGGNGR